MNRLRDWARSKAFQVLVIGLASGLLVLGMERLGWLETAERKSLDWRFRNFTPPGQASRDIVIVALDDDSFALRDFRENFGRWPVRRKLYAGLVHYLNQWGAKVIALDIIFQGPDPHEGDDALFARALAEKPNVVLANTLNLAGARDADPASAENLRRRVEALAIEVRLEAPLALRPYSGIDLSQDEFLDAAPRGGCITIQADADGPVRSVSPFFQFRDRFLPSFPLAIAAMALGQKPSIAVRGGPVLDFAGRQVPLSSDGRMLVRWYGGQGSYPYYSAWKVFNAALAFENGGQPDLPPETFKDKIVLIGVTAAAAGDVKPTAFSDIFAGVEVHATVLDNLLQGRFLREAGKGWTALAIFGLALLAASVVYLTNSALIYTLAAIALGLAYGALTGTLFRGSGVWLAMVSPLVAGTLSFTGSTLTRYATEGREKSRYRKTLLKYIAPQLVDTIMQDVAWEDLRAEKRHLTVLFSDIRGFTSISEKMPPEVVIQTLNEHLNMMVSMVFKHGGTLDKFIGDCVMAYWGAPLAQPNHAELAARTALEMVEGLEKLNKKWQSEGRPVLKIGVGLNTGEMLFGNIGSEQRMDFTVMGDNVNLGSRLESATKELHATIVISEATYHEIRDQAEVRPLGTITVKGKEQPVVVYELLGMKQGSGGEK
jgi:adenylate cyclase